MNDLLKSIPEELQQKLKEKKQPGWMSPMLAKLTHDVFSDANWIFERKLDGERCLVFKKNGRVELMSRNQKELNNTYPELVKALESQKADNFIADAEIVAFDGNVTSFRKLQKRMHLKDSAEIASSKVKVYIYVFDLMYHDGFELDELKLTERKKMLRDLLDFEDPIRYTPHRNENGKEYYQEACKKHWEGLIAKKANSNYAHSRSSNWLKFKCENQQEFVIVGYTKPQGERKGFGAILIGFYKDDQLKYAGKVGTGYTDQMLEDLHAQFQEIEVEEPAVSGSKLPSKDVYWLKPKMVAEVAFTEWTSTDKLRHPRYLGLRRDKKPKEVVKEA
ncbi:non-homologous end-joining DNA ligase [Gramella sp. GC03-9]|uniref:DNA ligase (ATP) n=1 Tax=Christiangramia oceanisediminis TaxID=2920386 RepID=A0A9X2I722_9FLAO|nr:non-homologous end-joining DNA ligase [Gramella oceanisediminis]MCP9198864.1 non-homologous end-joining DNA ligase [Gramella oceanisediminis]